MSRMTDATLSSREMVGMDAAAQAGMILGIIKPVGRLGLSTLFLRCGPRKVECHCRRACCSGHKYNIEWRSSLDVIAQKSKCCLPQNSRLMVSLRRAILIRIYIERGTFKQIGDNLQLDQETISRQHRAIYRWLMGYADGKNNDHVPGIEETAWAYPADLPPATS